MEILTKNVVIFIFYPQLEGASVTILLQTIRMFDINSLNTKD